MKRFILALVLCAFSLTANAELIKLDWKTSGDGLILRDTDTNLEWLHLSQTFNLSVNDVMGQWFGNTDIRPLAGDFSEFRYASKTEVAQLYADFGIVTLGNVNTPDNWIGANVAFQALGISGTRLNITLQEALSIDSPGVANAPEIVADSFSEIARAFVFPTPTLTNLYDFDDKDSRLGSYLVRDVSAVPIPATVWLFGSALGLLGWMRRK